MVDDSMDNYMETLAGYIYDDDKMVSYKWLSKELEVHVNIAKQILWEFWKQHKKQDDIVSTFMLIGHLTSGGMRVEVVRESNLSTAKEKFSTIISEHIYSLQKTLPDLEQLALAGEGDCRFSAITCKESVLRSEEELRALHWGSLFNNQPLVTSNEKISLSDKPSENESRTVSTTSNSNVVEKKAAAPKKNVKAQKNAFNNFFGKAAGQQKNHASLSPSKTTIQKAEDESSKVTLPTATNDSSIVEIEPTSCTKSVQRNAFNSFFGKTVSQEKSSESTSFKTLIDNTKEKSENCATIDKEKDRSIIDIKSSLPVNNRSLQEQENNKNISNSKKQTKSSKSIKTGRGKKRQRSKESNDVTKKRKRIVIVSDSSEESCMSEEEPEEPEQPEERPPLKESTPSPPHVKHVSGRRMVRKTVDKTFADEDGFLVTQKVHVYESCSEDEVVFVEEKKVTKPTQPQSETNNKTKKNTKQTKLTNFFKKS